MEMCVFLLFLNSAWCIHRCLIQETRPQNNTPSSIIIREPRSPNDELQSDRSSPHEMNARLSPDPFRIINNTGTPPRRNPTDRSFAENQPSSFAASLAPPDVESSFEYDASSEKTSSNTHHSSIHASSSIDLLFPFLILCFFFS